MIHLFNSKTEKNDLIQFNGEYILDNICSKATITEELNGEYCFEGIFRISNIISQEGYNLLTEGSILKVDDEYGEEFFRIASIDKTKYEIEVYARHITISDILTMWCEDVRPENQNGNGAINWIFDNAIGVKQFNVSSDISTTNTSYYMNKTVYEALFTADNSFIDRWGGEIYRRGFNIAINSKVGMDRGVSIRSRKNLIGFEASTNLNELTTRIYPKGFDGITINEKYVDSELINNYARVYARELTFEDVRVNDDDYTEGFETLEKAQEELKKRCKQKFEDDKIDVINASYRIDFIELGKTEQYKDYSILEKTWIGDIVNVIEESLDVDINVRVIKRQYDVKKKERVSTELSNKNTKNKPPTIGEIVAEMGKIPSSDSILQSAKDQATAIINAGMKNSYVIVRKNEILIMDTDDINTAVKVWRWNNGGLGYSGTGYYGQYGTAMTNDGAIVADFITTGVLNANIIKTGMIKSQSGESFFNLDTGEVNITGTLTSYRGDEFVSLNAGGILFQDHHLQEQMMKISSAYFKDENRNINGINFMMPKFSDYTRFAYIDKEDLTDGWTYEYEQFNFMDLWSVDWLIGTTQMKKGINVFSYAYHRSPIVFLKSSNEETGRIATGGDGSMLIGCNWNNSLKLTYEKDGLYYTGIELHRDDNAVGGCYIDLWGHVVVKNNLTVNGTKNRAVETKNYGTRLLNAYETADCLFGDIGKANTGNECKIKIELDDIFKETINVKSGYHVFLSKYGKGDIWTNEVTEDYFIVESESPNLEFSYEIKAKQLNYENTRLEKSETSKTTNFASGDET